MKSIILHYIRTSSSDQHPDEQSQILDSHFMQVPDAVHHDLDVDGSIPPADRSIFSALVTKLRAQHAGCPLVIRVTHVDRFFKATSYEHVLDTWRWLNRHGIDLQCVSPTPYLHLGKIHSPDLPGIIYDLLLARRAELGHATSARRPFRLDYAPLRSLLDSAAADVRALVTDAPFRLDNRFRLLAVAWRVYGGFNGLGRLLTNTLAQRRRDPGGWGGQVSHLPLLRALAGLHRRLPDLSDDELADRLNRKPGWRSFRADPWDRHSVRNLRESAGFQGYLRPLYLPDISPFSRPTLANGLFRHQQRALRLLAGGKSVLAVAATGAGKTLIAERHHSRLLASHPDHLTVVVAPYKLLVQQHAQRLGGLALAGAMSAPGNARNLRALARGDGNLVVLTPDKLSTLRHGAHPVLDAIRRRPSVLLVVDEADCVLLDAEYRDAYRYFAQNVRTLAPTQVLALSATVRPGFVERFVMGSVLARGAPWTTVRGELDRPNLYLQHHQLPNATARRVYVARLLASRRLKHLRGVLFVDTRQRAERDAAYFAGLGLRVDFYHSQRSDAANVRVVDAFRAGALDLVVATSGFGRGLDLALDYVMVGHIPANPSMLTQFFGRAGRDGRPAWCWWLTAPADFFFGDHIQAGRDDSLLPQPALRHLTEQTDRIQALARRASTGCLRTRLLRAQGQRDPLQTDPEACCLVCGQNHPQSTLTDGAT